jgi:methyl coenzyme M reductase gamma subunit
MIHAAGKMLKMRSMSKDVLHKPRWADEKFITQNYGLTHTPLFNLRKAGKIRSISTATDGAKYGKRLYCIDSIEAFFAAQEQNEKGGIK